MKERCVSIVLVVRKFEDVQEKLLNELENYFGEVPEEVLSQSYNFISKIIEMIAEKEGIPEEELKEYFFEKGE